VPLVRTAVYIDGLNLYYGALKNTPFKWLDVAAMSRHLLPGHEIVTIRYFTANVAARAISPGGQNRQQIYLRALRTDPLVRIELGHFLAHEPRMQLATKCRLAPDYVRVVRFEEKGSDVNLATRLLTDAFDDVAPCVVVVTNDSDLAAPIRVVKERFGRTVGLLCPHQRASKALLPLVTFMKPIRSGVLAASQFPSELADATGTFHKPSLW
jgi:uncharacterized LabA/DUF88 family protein